MKKETLYETLENINENYVKEAREYRKIKRTVTIKYASIAACFAVILMMGIITIPIIFNNDNVHPNDETEYKYESGYFYNIDDGFFSVYVGGKVIDEDKIGDKLSEVSVTAGWKSGADEIISTEKLRGEIYSINGIDTDVAVALKFLDKSEAVTTTHYYVIMNPNSDLTSVEEYIITPTSPNNSGNEFISE